MDTHAVTPALESFSAQLDAQWDFAAPAESERRFREELAKWPADDPRALIVATQIARTQSLRHEFAEANATLDAVEASLDGMPSHVRVRYLLGIAAPQNVRLDWDRKALAMTEETADARVKRWLAPLYNNIGYAYQERGDYATALVYYRKALPAYEARGDPRNVRVARWMIARAERSLGRLDEAEAIQRRLLAEYAKAGETDGYVYEELAEIALARGDIAAATPWAAKAYAALKNDPEFAANEDARLARLAAIAAGHVPLKP